MQSTREAIYAALAQELQIITGVNTVSRVYRPHTDYTAMALPAACLDEKQETAVVPTHGNPAIYTLAVDLWLYLPAPQLSQRPGAEALDPMTALNNALDALDQKLPNPPSPVETYNTLGGLVQHVWIEGKILKVSGVANGNTPVSIARVPILILTT